MSMELDETTGVALPVGFQLEQCEVDDIIEKAQARKIKRLVKKNTAYAKKQQDLKDFLGDAKTSNLDSYYVKSGMLIYPYVIGAKDAELYEGKFLEIKFSERRYGSVYKDGNWIPVATGGTRLFYVKKIVGPQEQLAEDRRIAKDQQIISNAASFAGLLVDKWGFNVQESVLSTEARALSSKYTYLIYPPSVEALKTPGKYVAKLEISPVYVGSRDDDISGNGRVDVTLSTHKMEVDWQGREAMRCHTALSIKCLDLNSLGGKPYFETKQAEEAYARKVEYTQMQLNTHIDYMAFYLESILNIEREI